MNEVKQESLLNSSVLVLAGADAAFAVIDNLIACGVGRVVLFTTEENLREFSSGETVLEIHRFESLEKIEQLVSCSNVVVETLLDWQLKLGLSDLSMRAGVPLIHSGIVGHRYQIYPMIPSKSACLRCTLPLVGIEDFPLGKVENHPLYPVESWAAAAMSLDVVKIIAEVGILQANTLFRFDPVSGDYEAIRNLTPQKDCPDCGIYFR